jgi:putative membrane protein
MMFWYGSGWLWWQASLMWAGMLVFWGLLIWGAYALIRSATSKPGRQGPDSDAARHILDERLARGDITAEDYQRLRGLIDAGKAPVGPRAGR